MLEDAGNKLIKLKLLNPVKELDPDSWNNIPVCIVKAFKNIKEYIIEKE